MFYTYVVFSPTYDKIYIGHTNSLQHRVIQHNESSSHGWTRRYKPWQLIYHETFKTKSDAIKRERELKSHQGRKYIREILIPQYKSKLRG
ncbi:MAG: GIY-YIG nuclease family protein [Candidatus Marinimicrobia bacterium]|nr:GIY-YIG nuclease family protein [Candidatus Neomarinimicrobiota bacterium]